MFQFKTKGSAKNEMLKSVFEENMRIVGKGDLRPKHNWLNYIRTRHIFIAVFALLLLGTASRLDSIHVKPDSSVSPSTATQSTQTNEPSMSENSDSTEAMSFINDKNLPIKKVFGLGVRTIVIDPGHGGTDPGTIGKSGLMEKDIALDIARRLETRLKQAGFKVILTRYGDESVTLNKRTEIANTNKADLFISIHMNSLPVKPMNIIETYYFGSHDDNAGLQLATKENVDSNFRMSEFQDMVKRIGHRLKLQESKKLAAFIQNSLYSNIKEQSKDVKDYGVKRAPFVVLLGIEMPGILAEVTCMSNKEQEAKLFTEGYRDDIAKYLEGGILRYLDEGENTNEGLRRNNG